MRLVWPLLALPIDLLIRIQSELRHLRRVTRPLSAEGCRDFDSSAVFSSGLLESETQSCQDAYDEHYSLEPLLIGDCPLLRPNAIRFGLIVACSSLLLSGVESIRQVHAQEPASEDAVAFVETADEKRERLLVERFFSLLKKRPRLGTALDKVYGYHIGAGSLDTFVEDLQKEAESGGDGNLWMVLGMVQMRRGQDSAATVAFEKAERLLTENPLASYYYGKALVLVGSAEEAAEAMRRAISREPSRADALQMFKDLGRVYQRMGRKEDALEAWKELEALFPGDEAVQEQIAAILAEEGEREQALERYEKLSQATKDRFRKVEMAVASAQLKAELGRNEEALKDFEQQLAVVNPDSWLHRDIRQRIEDVFWSSNDLDGLVDYYSQWTEEHPEDVDAMLRTARILSVQKRTSESLEWFNKAIERAPSNADARLSLVETLASEGRYSEATKQMEELVSIDQKNPDLLVRWGELMLDNDDFSVPDRKQKAAEIWKRMLADRPEDPVVASRVADLLRGAEMSEDAITQYRTAIHLAPEDSQYREYLGEYLFQLGREEDAMATWQELASGERRTRDNLVRLSEVLSTFKFDEKALETMAEACEMKPLFGHRARYAELLRKSEDYEAALKQLDLAEQLADERELLELVIDERILNFQARGDLDEQIAKQQEAAEAAKDDAAAWRLLALMLEADRSFQAACQAIENATALAGNDALYWESAASLFEKTGRWGEAVAAYRKLTTLDRRFLSNYLMQIANLELRLGNTEAALKAGEQLMASAPANSEYHRFFADLCSQLGQNERGLQTLRRSVRSNPNDIEATRYLAGRLADEFKTAEAIELYWRCFELESKVEDQISVIESMADLYLRSNRFEQLIDRLEKKGRESNKPRNAAMWVASAHRSAGDLSTARKMLEQLMREVSRDTNLLEQLVTLAKSEYDYAAAVEYQKRLVAAAPSSEREYQLAGLLMDAGEVEEAQAVWIELTRKGKGKGKLDTGSSINSMMAKGRYELALSMIERATKADPSDWDLLSQKIICHLRLGQQEKVEETAEQILSLNVADTELTKSAKQNIARYAKSNATRLGYNPMQGIGSPYYTVQRMASIARSLQANPNIYFSGVSNANYYEPQCFAELKATALMAKQSSKTTQERREHIQTVCDKALESEKPKDLWDALLQLTIYRPEIYYSDTTSLPAWDDCLDKLIEQEDADAAMLMLTRWQNSRRRAVAMPMFQAISKKELDRLEEIYTIAKRSSAVVSVYLKSWLAEEYLRSGQTERFKEFMNAEVELADADPLTLIQVGSSVFSMQLRQQTMSAETKQLLEELSLPFIKKGIQEATAKTQNVTYITSSTTNFVAMLSGAGMSDAAISITDELLALQARLAAEMRPSQRDTIDRNPSVRYSMYQSGRTQSGNVTFPPATGYFNASTIGAVRSLFELAKTQEGADALNRWLDDMDVESSDPYLNFARLMTKASMAVWSKNRKQAIASLEELKSLELGTQMVSLVLTRLHYEAGDTEKALASIKDLKPTSQKLLVDRELTYLQLVLEIGDLEEAKKAANRLFSLRLDSATQFKLADILKQLGMSSKASQVMERIRRRAGGNQQTLVQLMQKYSREGEEQKAVEIARQLIRRSQPATNSRTRSSSQNTHSAALAVLKKAKELEPLTRKYEELVKRSPKSKKLVDQLVAIYEASGRRTEANKLRTNLLSNRPSSPQGLLSQAQALTSQRQYEAAAETYLKLIKKSPEVLNQSYYEMRTAFQQSKSWPKMVDLIIEEDINRFPATRVGEIYNELIRARQTDDASRMFDAIVKQKNWQTLEYALRLGSTSSSLKLTSEQLERLADAAIDIPDNLNSLGSSISFTTNGQATGVVQSIANLIGRDEEQVQRAIGKLKERVQDNGTALGPRLMLCGLLATQADSSEIKGYVKPLLQSSAARQQSYQALWSLASQLLNKDPQMTKWILESFDDIEASNFGFGGMQFSSSPKNLLVSAYRKTGDSEKARDILVEAAENLKSDSRYRSNPGYGEYQFIRSLADIAQKLVDVEEPLFALVVYQRAFEDPDLLEATQRYKSNLTRSKTTLKNAISRAMNGAQVEKLVKMLIAEEDDTLSQFAFKVKVESKNQISSDVTMPLESILQVVGKSDEQKKSLQGILNDDPLEVEDGLGKLVCRLLIAQAFDLQDERDNAVEALESFVENTGAEQPEDRRKELMFAIAARSLASEEKLFPLVIKLTEKALAAAEELDEEKLQFGLQCQLARQLAKHDIRKPHATKLYWDALNTLLPDDSEE